MGWFAQRLAMFVATLLVAALIIFVVLDVLPGDPAAVTLGLNAAPEALQALRLELGLDRPAPERFLTWLTDLATGNMGQSQTYRVPVSSLVAERLPVTLPLALMAMLLSTVIALPLALFAAANHNRAGDTAVMIFAQIGLAIPNFWFGILLVLAFSVGLGWFPAGGFPGWSAGFLAGLQALLLPAIALALPQAAILARVARASVLEALQEDFARTARARGLSRRAVLLRHVLRNAMIPVVTIMGLQFSFLIAGAIIIENVFALPGLGRLTFQAIAQHDLVTVKSLVMLFAALVILINFAIEILYGLIDPRLARRP